MSEHPDLIPAPTATGMRVTSPQYKVIAIYLLDSDIAMARKLLARYGIQFWESTAQGLKQ